MEINSISTPLPAVAGKAGTATTSLAKPTAASSTITAATAAPSTTATTVTTSPSAPALSKSTSGQPAAPPQSEASASSTEISTLVSATYSTSVGGRTYSANITQSNGTYTLSVRNLPGADVSESSLNAAESALRYKIDTLA